MAEGRDRRGTGRAGARARSARTKSPPVALRDGHGRQLTLQRERAYAGLRERIILLELAPGTVLDEPGLTRALGIGRTPVHEALMRLSHEGFVRIMPRRGMIVSEMSVFELQQVYESRAVIEPASTRLAAQRATREEVEYLEGMLDRVDALLEARDFRGVLAADEAFHLGLVRASQNKYLIDMVHTIHSLTARFWYFSLLRLPADVPRAQMAGHRDVLRAVAAGDPAAAEAAMRAVVSRTPNDLAGLIY